MNRTVAAAAIAATAFLSEAGSASAQTDAQDRCVETAVSNLLADPLIKRDTFYWLSRLSASAAGQQSNEPAPSGPISIEGITAPLSYADVERMLRPLLPPADWQTIYRNRAAVLLASGQQPVVQAWQNCLAGLGGGLGAYVRAVPNQPTSIELHIENLRPENAGELPTWRVAKNVTIEPRLGKAVGRPECLARNYSYAPGSDCVIKLETPSAWSSGTITLSLTDGKTAKEISAYVAPRPSIHGEQQTWPTEKMAADWSAAHPNENPINVLSRYTDEKSGARPWDLSAQRDAAPGWYFIEGPATPAPDGSYMLRSDGIQVSAKVSGSADQQDCVGGYRIDETGKILFMGIGLGVSQRGPSWCYVTITAMMGKLVFDPPRSASDVVLPVTRRPPQQRAVPTAATTEPAATPAAAPLSPERAAVCAQRYRSFDPQTGTYLGTDGSRHPCR
jgi:BA14K-like protein